MKPTSSSSRRKLRPGEVVDVFVADLRRLAGLFGGMPDSSLACAFVTKLPESARRALRAGTRIEGMTLSQLISRARAVLADEEATSVAAAVGGSARSAATTVTVKCYSCGQPNHIARNCTSGRGQARTRGIPRWPQLHQVLQLQPCRTRRLNVSGKRRGRGEFSASVLSRSSVTGALPVVRLSVDR